MKWKDASVVELAEHFCVTSSALVAKQLKMYRERGDEAMQDKILAARKLAIAKRLYRKSCKLVSDVFIERKDGNAA
jgi:hypothetical protein